MAIITNQTSSGNALTLNSKEALLLPFSLGSYNSVRCGIFVGLTTDASTNASYQSENLTANAPQNCFYFGLVTNTTDLNNLLPYSPNQNFIGISSAIGNYTVGVSTNTSNGISISSNNTNLIALSAISGNQQITQFSGASTQLMNNMIFADTTNATGSGFFATFYGLALTINNYGQANQNFSMQTCTANNGGNYYTNVSSTNLRSLIANFASPDTATGFMWNNNNPVWTGAALPSQILPLPSGILVYSPFSFNRLKIYNIEIDKY